MDTSKLYTFDSLAHGSAHATLMRRTYTLLLATVLATAATVYAMMQSPSAIASVSRHPWLSLLCVFAPLIALFRFREDKALSIGLTFAFAMGEGALIAPLLARVAVRSPGIITAAAVLSVGAFGILTLYAWVSRRDFSAWGAFFTVGLYVLVVTMLLVIFVPGLHRADAFIAGATVFIFGGLTVYDTWRIRMTMEADDYVLAVVMLYLDFVNLFLAVLRVLDDGH